jgi:C4-dicarboxylate-specific signal transduction histidine kinase
MTEPTNTAGERFPRERELAFFGKITASASHELNNVIAIVNEYSGLLGDMVAGLEHGRPLDPARIDRASQAIQKQIKRGQTIIQRLNRFAHSADEPVQSCDLAALTMDIADHALRMIEKKQAQLERRLPDQPVIVENSPFALQQAIFIALQLHLDVAESGDAIALELRQEEQGAAIEIAGAPGRAAVDSDEFNLLVALMSNLGGAATLTQDKHCIALAVPAKLP